MTRTRNPGLLVRATDLSGISALIQSGRSRPLQFVVCGVSAAAVQLIVLSLLLHHSWHDIGANATAFLVSAQLNFVLSVTLTWHDRHGSRSLFRSWLLFHGSIGAMALVNMTVYLVARLFMPTVDAAALGICVASLGNYLSGDRVIFRHRLAPEGKTPPRPGQPLPVHAGVIAGHDASYICRKAAITASSNRLQRVKLTRPCRIRVSRTTCSG